MSKSKKNKKQNKKRRILLALLLILFTGSILTASTYAWFTSNRTVRVETIDVQVTTANGLQVSTDAINWKTIITNEDLTNTLANGFGYSGNTNQLPLKNSSATVKPVSTAGTVNNGKINMYLGNLRNDATGNPVLTTTKSTETKGNRGDFVVFDLFFQVTQNTEVRLAQGSDVKISQNTSSDKGLKSAARVAWLNLGNVGINDTPEAAQGLNAGTTVKIWEPNNNTHTTAAINDAMSVYGLTITNNQQVGSYYGVDKEFTDVSLRNLSTETIGDKFVAVTPTIKSPVGGVAADTEWFTLAAGVTKVRFYLWIEGQDVDCENNASGDAIGYQMSFTIHDTEQQQTGGGDTGGNG